jgi:hypothetical protein
MQHCGHNYSSHANLLLNWVGTDQPHNQRAKLDPSFRPTWLESGWTDDTVIDYQFNSGGFRTEEFDQSRRILILGSSPTVGVGLHRSQTWPELLSKKINRPVWNLATGTGCSDTMYRVLKNYLPQLNVSMVIELGGEKDAFEMYYQNQWQVINSPTDIFDSALDGAKDAWYSDLENLKINQEKNTAAMKWICHENRVPYYKFSLSEIRIKNYDMIGQSDCSRCGHHAGPKFHTAAADYIADHINL